MSVTEIPQPSQERPERQYRYFLRDCQPGRWVDLVWLEPRAEELTALFDSTIEPVVPDSLGGWRDPSNVVSKAQWRGA